MELFRSRMGGVCVCVLSVFSIQRSLVLCRINAGSFEEKGKETNNEEWGKMSLPISVRPVVKEKRKI